MLAAAGGSLVTALLILSLPNRGQEAIEDAEYEKNVTNTPKKSEHVYASKEDMSKVRWCTIAIT